MARVGKLEAFWNKASTGFPVRTRSKPRDCRMILETGEKQMITLDVTELIRASSETAELLRPAITSTDDFAGPHAPSEEYHGTMPIEFQQLSPDDLKQLGADGQCFMLPDADMKEGDVLIFEEIRYTISDIKPVNCFGAVSHLVVKLERENVKRD